MARPRGGEWLEDEICGLSQAGVGVVVSLLTEGEIAELDLQDEPTLCAARGLEFVRFPIEDRGVPRSESRVLELFRSLAEHVRSGRGVAVHCRAGIGRSALVAAGVLSVLGIPVAQAFTLITECRGCAVPDTPEQARWLENLARRG